MAYVKWLYRVAFLAVTLLAVAAVYLYSGVTSPVNIDSETKFEVVKGDSAHSLGQRLAQADIIPEAYWTRIAAKLQPAWVPKVGEYAIQPGSSLMEVMALFDSGESIFYDITLLEGKTTQDYLQTMREKGNIKMTLLGLSNEEIAQKLNLSVPHPEGQFFANTYRYHDGDTDVSILKHANGLLVNTLDVLWQSKAEGLPYKTPYEALIMASIIEKETAVPAERPLIARVFISRLQKRMRLQTDPTVIYGLGDEYDGNLTRKGLRSSSPYNTYRVFGLPPTPIANVGRAAIEAALNPGQTKALYFVAKGDGSHAFSNTLKEHNRAVRQYQYKRREDYRSTPQEAE
ncbi:endolytic transglycosylase MltG [Marinomonas sp. THO17]|uniref:endolytic transglycosylase MltG n=1 Tax=Marinomonas sp. THO17 TaxID=3149048 RepID=UPI00336BBF8B